MAKKQLNFVSESKLGRKYLNPSPDVLALPNLTEVQTDSFKWFLREGLAELFEEVSPIDDYTGKLVSISFKDYWLGDAKYSEKLSKEKKVTYEAPLKANVEVHVKETNKKKIQEVFLGDMPVMTDRGTFI